MQKRPFGKYLIVGALLAAGPACAQDITAGAKIAQTWCSNCHQVDYQQLKSGSDAAPSFPSIAQMKSTTAASLAAFLITAHARMPDYTLSRAEIKDVSAYILSLRKAP